MGPRLGIDSQLHERASFLIFFINLDFDTGGAGRKPYALLLYAKRARCKTKVLPRAFAKKLFQGKSQP